MPGFIRKVVTGSGATAVQIVYKQGRKVAGITHIGSAHNEHELAMLLALARVKQQEGQLTFEFFEAPGKMVCLESSYSSLLWENLERVYKRIGFGAIGDKVYQQLVLARIIEPVSKLDTIRVLGGLGLEAPSNSAIHRSLKKAAAGGYRDIVSRCCFEYVQPAALTLVLYDVTTLYFEAQKDDEYRKPGLSKERRLEPQITVGLLVDGSGFPLEIQSFEGNRAEVKTIAPVLEGFKTRHNLRNITVTADAGMLSAGNIETLEKLGYHYIIGSRLAKTPYDVELHITENRGFEDGEILETLKIVTVNGKRVKRREIFQYRKKRAALDLLNIDKTVSKAQKIISRKADIKRNRFLKITGDKREINEELVEQVRRRAGIKGYVTDLDIPAQQVIDAYHQLFQVEKSFRISKSDLKARPIFHRKRDSIEAHLTVVFAALAIARHIEARAGVSIKKFVKLLEPIRSGVISVDGVQYQAKPKISDAVAALLAKI